MKTSKKTTIIFYSGPSGGHLFPAQATAEVLRHKNPELRLLMVTSHRARPIADAFPQHVFSEVVFFPELSFSRRHIFGTILKLPIFLWKNYCLIRKESPACVVGFGSFVAFFGVKLSNMLRIPTLIHEQNKVPGKASRMLKTTADCILSTFPETFGTGVSEKVSGLPIRSFLWQASRTPKEKLPSDKVCLLIMGGSQGSEYINEISIQVLSRFPLEKRLQISVIHNAGNADLHTLKHRYKELQVDADVYDFYRNMEEHYHRADIVLSRAGANSLFECACFGIPVLAIPYPFAEAHQVMNIKEFERKGAASYHEQKEGCEDWLFSELEKLIDSREERGRLSENIKKMVSSQASEYCADEVLAHLK